MTIICILIKQTNNARNKYIIVEEQEQTPTVKLHHYILSNRNGLWARTGQVRCCVRPYFLLMFVVYCSQHQRGNELLRNRLQVAWNRRPEVFIEKMWDAYARFIWRSVTDAMNTDLMVILGGISSWLRVLHVVVNKSLLIIWNNYILKGT